MTCKSELVSTPFSTMASTQPTFSRRKERRKNQKQKERKNTCFWKRLQGNLLNVLADNVALSGMDPIT
jgi:hypothetical protein